MTVVEKLLEALLKAVAIQRFRCARTQMCFTACLEHFASSHCPYSLFDLIALLHSDYNYLHALCIIGSSGGLEALSV